MQTIRTRNYSHLYLINKHTSCKHLLLLTNVGEISHCNFCLSVSVFRHVYVRPAARRSVFLRSVHACNANGKQAAYRYGIVYIDVASQNPSCVT